MIHTTEYGSVRVLRMERGKVQALDVDLLLEIERALDAVTPGARALVLTGTGTSFSAGVDLLRIVEGTDAQIVEFLAALRRVLLRLFSWPLPFVTAINGHAVAGGALLGWCGDLRVMAAGEGRIGVPELRVGVAFPGVAMAIARFATAGQHLQELLYLGRTYAPEDAQRYGLVDEVVAPDALLPRAVELATTLAALPPSSFGLTKRALRGPVLEALARAEGVEEEVVSDWLKPDTRIRIADYMRRIKGR
jgi:enoyl-CoA hydratase